MPMRFFRCSLARRAMLAIVAILAPVVSPRPARAQHGGHEGMPGMDMPADSTRPPRWHFMAQAIPVLTRADHTAGGVDLSEGYLAQVVAMARGHWWNGHANLDAAFNAEGLTMRRGELSTGAFGEGFIDRRHPHTYLHELVLSGVGAVGPVSYSASAGRGFVPFGTDDPMMRPFEKYPINHHLSQILERVLVMGAVRLGPAIVEGATFGGDEPTAPSSAPQFDRFGDSWSVRATALPVPALELQGSYARVASPEQTSGFGLDQRKRNFSLRAIDHDGSRYLLGEWARTEEFDDTRHVRVFAYESALVEGAATLGPVGLALRFEQTDRPEEERLADLFRTPRPAPDLGISGITRWRTATLAVTLPSVTPGAFRGYPFVEVERLNAAARDSRSAFSPPDFYGTSSPWMLSVGFRLRYGPMHARMGRYGVALPTGPAIGSLAPGDVSSTQHHH